MGRIIKITFFMLLLMITHIRVEAANLETFFERIDLSGYLRVRSWSVLSKTYVPGTFKSRHTYKHVNYFDLFFRNRITLKVIPEVEVRSVFDINSKFGKNESSIDGGTVSFIARDIYAMLRPHSDSELSIGLQPFSLPGGYIIARDATGLQYAHYFAKKKVSIYASYIKAFDDADDSFGQGSDIPDFIWDDIIIVGTKFNIGSIINGEAYYVYEDDRYTTNRLTYNTINYMAGLTGDGRKGSLHWIGLHAKILTGNWFLRLGGIFNAGTIYVRNQFYAFRKVKVRAGLLEFETGFTINDFQLSLIAEGATGDPNNSNTGISFQDIKGSHDFSYIVVDSNGGIALRGSGESCWYGLYGCGININYTLLDSFILQGKLLHFGTTKVLYWRGKGTTWFGDEIDIGAEYKARNIVSIFINAGGFLPQRGYNAMDNMSNNYWGQLNEVLYNDLLHDIDNYSSRSMIFEIMLGVKISYD